MTTLTLPAPVLFEPTPSMATVATLKGAKVKPASQVQRQTVAIRQNPSDEELISAICHGAEWALETLYDRYHRYAYALAYRILHESTSAEDIVQEVFLSVWRKAASYQKHHGSVFSWLQAIVHHRAIDRVRSAAHRDHQWTPLQAEGEQDPPSDQREVWEQAWQHEQSELIRQVLEQLPSEQRQVIELAYFGGYTHAEIAEKENIPLGTVKGRMRLGLQKMKHLLREYDLDATY
jgi:RNA polymerase sigma-70 factor (ECF subfamily)